MITEEERKELVEVLRRAANALEAHDDHAVEQLMDQVGTIAEHAMLRVLLEMKNDSAS